MEKVNNATEKEALIREQVEKIGVFLEQQAKASAITPLAGRLFAFLILSDPPYQNFYDITEFLQASKSSISTALKALEQSGLVDYFTFSGDRKRYFRVNTKKWLEVEQMRLQQATIALGLAQDILEFRKDSKHQDFNEGVEKVVEFYEYITLGMQDLLEKWKSEQKSTK